MVVRVSVRMTVGKEVQCGRTVGIRGRVAWRQVGEPVGHTVRTNPQGLS